MDRYLRVMLVFAVVLAGGLIFVPSAYIGAGGMVGNQGFELGEEGVPSGWNLTGNARRVDTGPIYDGSWAAQVTGNGDTLTKWLCLGNGTVLPITYEVWGWIYVTGNVTGIIAFDFWVGLNGTQVSSTTILSATDTNGVYVQRAGSMMSPTGATYLRIRLYGVGWSEEEEVRFDEIGCWPVTGYCFIATAAYGTETAAQVNILRDFRDRVLLKNPLGSLLVNAYYKLSPPAAAVIAEHDFVRAVVREIFLNPVVKLLQWSQELWRA